MHLWRLIIEIKKICDRICERGPLRGKVNMLVRRKTCKLDISRNRGLLHHQNLWYISYLRGKFETRSPFLCLKRGPNAFTIAVMLVVYGLDRKCNADNIQERIRRCRGRPDVKCIHCARIAHLEEVARYARQRLLLRRINCATVVPSLNTNALAAAALLACHDVYARYRRLTYTLAKRTRTRVVDLFRHVLR